MIKCLVDRAFKINNTWLGFDSDLKDIVKTLKQNLYPQNLIDKTIKTYLDNFYSNKQKKKKDSDIHYFKLPYLGKFSEQIKRKLHKTVSKYCKDGLQIKIVFNSFKIKQYFCYKDRVPTDLKSNLVYKFSCQECGSCYIGETSRHFKTRIDNHLKSDKNSHIFKHLNNNARCLNSVSKDSFKILDIANNSFDLKIKEALHIHWDKPSLNAQVKHFALTLF